MSIEAFPTIPYGEKPPANYPKDPPNIGNTRGYRFAETLRPGVESGKTLRGVGATEQMPPTYRSRGEEGTNIGLREIEKQQGVQWEADEGPSAIPPVEKMAFFNEQTERINRVNSLIEEAYRAQDEEDEEQGRFFYNQAIESVSKIMQDQVMHDRGVDRMEFAERMVLLLNGLQFRNKQDENAFRKEAKTRAFDALRKRAQGAE